MEKQRRCKKNKLSERFLATFIIVVALFVLQISVVSALEFDNVKNEKETTFDGKQTKDYPLLERYKPIEIKNMFGLGRTQFEGYIDKHTESCGQDCSSTIKLKTGQDGVLIDNIIFKTLQEDESWVEQDVRSYQFYINTENKKVSVNDYEYQCENGKYNSKNDSYEQICQNVLIGSHEEDAPEWTPYNLGEEIKEGTYEIRLDAKKKPSRTVDWVIKTNGEWLESWAVWAQTFYDENTNQYWQSTPQSTNDIKGSLVEMNNGSFYLINISCSQFCLMNMSYVAEYVNSTTAIPLGNSVIINGVADYSEQNILLEDGKKYILSGDKQGATYNTHVSSVASAPISLTHSYWEKGVTMSSTSSITGFNTNDIYDIYRMTIQETTRVTLNSPTNGYISTSNEVTFNATATVTGGATLTNMSLWTNESGSWELKNTTTIIEGATNNTGSNTVYNATETSTSSTSNVLVKTFSNINAKIINVTSWGKEGGFGGNPVGRINVTYTYSDATVYSQQTTLPDTTYRLFTFINPNQDKLVSNIKIYLRRDGGDGGILMYEKNSTINGESPIQTFQRTITEPIIWNVQACDTDGDCGFSISNFSLGIDAIAPTITVESPNGTLNSGAAGQNEILNVTFTDSSLDSCWYNYNGTNVTIAGCQSGVKNSTLFILEANNLNMTIYANDKVGNLNSTVIIFDYFVFLNNNTHNASTLETASEGFEVNVTANSSLTAVTLDYNGTDYSLTDAGSGIWSTTIDIPEGVQNNSFRYDFTYGASTITVGDYYQDVSSTFFAQCNATYAVPFINYTFVNENNESAIPGSVPSGTFNYWLGEGTVNKTLTVSSSAEDLSYTFCSNVGSRTLNLDARIQYESAGYPQRVANPPEIEVTNSTLTTKVLYLLPAADGIYVTFRVINAAEQIISDVDINATRIVGSSQELVGEGSTDSSGGVTMWLNPDFVHAFVFSKTGYATYSSSFAPTQTSYTISLGGSSTTTDTSEDYVKGITFDITPRFNSPLYDNLLYNFNFSINSSFWELESFGFNLYDELDNWIAGANETTSSNGGTVGLNHNVTGIDGMKMSYWWEVNGTFMNATRFYVVLSGDGTSWSINNTMTDFRTYLGDGMFGMDNFTVALLIFMIMLISVGVISYKFGLTSPTAVSLLIFTIVLLLDVGLNLMAFLNPWGIPHFITIFTGFIMMSALFREFIR